MSVNLFFSHTLSHSNVIFLNFFFKAVIQHRFHQKEHSWLTFFVFAEPVKSRSGVALWLLLSVKMAHRGPSQGKLWQTRQMSFKTSEWRLKTWLLLPLVLSRLHHSWNCCRPQSTVSLCQQFDPTSMLVSCFTFAFLYHRWLQQFSWLACLVC